MAQATCSQLGGSCNEELHGDNAADLAQAMYDHVAADHSDDVQRLTGSTQSWGAIQAKAAEYAGDEE